MKPTEKQIKVIDTILSIIKTWKDTNDIDSPTHFCDMHEFMYADLESEDIVTQDESEKIEDKLSDLLIQIRHIF